MALIPGITVRKLLTNIGNFSYTGGMAYDETSQDLLGAGDNVVVSVRNTTSTIRSSGTSATPIILDYPQGLAGSGVVQSQVTGAQLSLPGGYSGGTYATWSCISEETGQPTFVRTYYSAFGGAYSSVSCARGAIIGGDPGDRYGPTGQLIEPPGISGGVCTSGFPAPEGGGSYTVYAHHRDTFIGQFVENGTGLSYNWSYMNPPTFVWVADNNPPFFAHASTTPNFYGGVLAESFPSISDIGHKRTGAFSIYIYAGLGVSHQNRDVYANPVAPLHNLIVDGFGPSRPIQALASYGGYVMGIDGGGALFTWWQGRAQGPSRALKFLGTLPFSFAPNHCVVGLIDGQYWGLFYGQTYGADGYTMVAVTDTHQNSNPPNVTVKDGKYVNADPLLPGQNSTDADKQMNATVDSRKVDAW